MTLPLRANPTRVAVCPVCKTGGGVPLLPIDATSRVFLELPAWVTECCNLCVRERRERQRERGMGEQR